MSKDLHDEIMNLPASGAADYDAYPLERASYKIGHRDARHAAAELAISSYVTEAELVAARNRIAKLEALVAERDAMLGKRPCQNSRCSELNAARALLREALDTIEEFPDEYHEIADRIKSYFEACDKPGELT